MYRYDCRLKVSVKKGIAATGLADPEAIREE